MIRRSLRSGALALFFALFASSFASAQLFVISMTESGKVYVNDTLFFSLPSSFKVSNGAVESPEQRWWDQVLVGQDLYHLRLDGQVRKNGERMDPQVQTLSAAWLYLAVSPGGDVYTLDFFGRVALNGVLTYDLPDDPNTGFADFFYEAGDRYHLRTDGAIYRNTSGTPVWTLPGTAGVDLERWMAFVYADNTDRIYSLRRDGVVRYVESGGASAGEFVVDLPVGNQFQRYNALQIDQATGFLYALRDDGIVYVIDPGQSPASSSQYVNWPGDGSGSEFFMTFGQVGSEFLGLRYDGRMFLGLLTEELCRLAGSGYRSVVLSDLPPVTTNVKNAKTVVAPYKTTCYVGDTVEFPILASDINTDQLSYQVIEQPAGSTVDLMADPPTFSYTAAAAGKFNLAIEVGDGTQVKTYKYAVVVKEVDLDPLKNVKPVFQKLKKVQALVGVPIEIPLRAFDADGDPLTYAIDGDLPVGMSFDPNTQTLSWVPVFCAAKVKVAVTVDDGSGKLSKGKIQLTVVTPFWF